MYTLNIEIDKINALNLLMKHIRLAYAKFKLKGKI